MPFLSFAIPFRALLPAHERTLETRPKQLLCLAVLVPSLRRELDNSPVPLAQS